jgi:hypothetical protein
VRNRVAHDDARVTRALVARTVRVAAALTLLPAALFVAGAQAASADTGVAGGGFPSGLGGVVGIIAVILGVGGFVVGLLRRRRISAARAAALLAARQAQQPAPARSESAA